MLLLLKESIGVILASFVCNRKGLPDDDKSLIT